jgi:outer membrane immunogenic protein
MRRMLVAVLGLSVATQALADGVPPPPFAAVPVAMVPAWTGFYAGFGGGGNALNTELSARAAPGVSDPGPAGAAASLDGLGAAGGFLQLNGGYDYQLASRWVIGAVANVDFDNTRTTLSVSVPGAPLQARAKLSMDNSWSIGARVGYLTSPGTLLFVTGGYTEVLMSDKLRIGGPFPEMAVSAHVPNFGGGFIGAGAETLITEHISLRGEYRFTDFGSGQLGLPTINGTDINDFIVAHAAPTMQDGRVSVNYRF